MYNRRPQAYAGIILVVFIMLIGLVPTTQATRFVLASWAFPDEYGQGIGGVSIYENSTGAWLYAPVVHGDGPFYGPVGPDLPHVYEWNASVGIKISFESYFNSTLTGVSDSTEGRNCLRHDVTVADNAGVQVFSQQNFTYLSVNDYTYDPIWIYDYEVILNFLSDHGQIYTVTVLYEIFW